MKLTDEKLLQAKERYDQTIKKAKEILEKEEQEAIGRLGFPKVGDRFKTKRGCISVVEKVYVSWNTEDDWEEEGRFTIYIDFYEEGEDFSYAHRTCWLDAEGFKELKDAAGLVPATETDKSIEKKTLIQKVILHTTREDWNGTVYSYIAFSIKEKCVAFETTEKGIDKITDNTTSKIILFRNKDGKYNLKVGNKVVCKIEDLLGVYDNHRELTTEFLI